MAPTVVETVPAPQSLHAALPVAILYLPATQAAHGPVPSGPEKPTLHVQAARAELELGELELVGHARQAAAAVAPTVVETVPAPQSLHAALPVAILYLPATQAVHTSPLGPVNPTLHVQAATAELASGELECAGHATQVAASKAFVYVPAIQAVQLFPAGHVVSVRSTPFTMALAIASVASVFRTSSTKSRPATLAFKY